MLHSYIRHSVEALFVFTFKYGACEKDDKVQDETYDFGSDGGAIHLVLSYLSAENSSIQVSALRSLHVVLESAESVSMGLGLRAH